MVALMGPGVKICLWSTQPAHLAALAYSSRSINNFSNSAVCNSAVLSHLPSFVSLLVIQLFANLTFQLFPSQLSHYCVRHAKCTWSSLLLLISLMLDLSFCRYTYEWQEWQTDSFCREAQIRNDCHRENCLNISGWISNHDFLEKIKSYIIIALFVYFIRLKSSVSEWASNSISCFSTKDLQSMTLHFYNEWIFHKLIIVSEPRPRINVFTTLLKV